MNPSWSRIFILSSVPLVIVFALRAEKNMSCPSQTMATGSPAPSPSETLNLPGPGAQNLMLGTWSIKSKYAPSEELPNGGTGEGLEVWRPGPGGRSVIEELHEKSTNGELNGMAVAWWDEKEQGQRFVWCDNIEPHGCYVSRSVAKWDGNRLVYTEEIEKNGKSVTKQEVFSDITSTSFVQILQAGPTGGEMKPVVTMKATKLSEGNSKSRSNPLN